MKNYNASHEACSRHPLFHVPHCGTLFPPELMESVCIPEDEFLQYHRLMSDTGAMELVPLPFRREPFLVRFPVSRLLCDVERFIGSEETMEQYGMGFCYEKAFDGRKIKNVTPELKEKTLKYYRQHHFRLDRLAEEFQHSLLIDLHSFSEEILPPGFKTGLPLPDICIGTDSLFTPPSLAAAAERIFTSAGFTVATDYPYSGTLVPNAVLSGRIRSDMVSIMLEINKSVYLDGNLEVIPSSASLIQNAIREILQSPGDSPHPAP